MKRRLIHASTLALTLVAGRAQAQTATQAPVFIGEIDQLHLDPACAGDFCSGTMVVAGETVVIPANLLIDLPANRLTLKQIFDQAPTACVATGESGLAATDLCAAGHASYVTMIANRTRCGEVIAGDMLIQKDLIALAGTVTFIDYTGGWFRLDGTPGDAATGTMVRLNDPAGVFTVQAGLGCDGGPNCSPDPRFTGDPVNYTFSYSTGYPACIPSTIVPTSGAGTFTSGRRTGANPATGEGDPLCPTTNRPAVTIDPVAADSTRFAPLMLGDNVFVAGNFETVAATEFLSAHTITINVGLMTRDDPTQPDYVQINEVVWDLPNFPINRTRFRAIGTGTLPGSGRPPSTGNDLDLYAARFDPRDGIAHMDPLASTMNNPGTNGLGSRPLGPNIWRIDYNVTFPPVATKPNQPCTNLLNAGLLVGAAASKCPNGGTLEENFSVLSPVSREVFARTRHKAAAIAAALAGGPAVPVTLDVLGSPANQGEYLRPLGGSLGGLEFPVPTEFDLNAGALPFTIEGLPWALDRRVSPTGCDKGGCEPLGAFPIGRLALDRFPFSGHTPDQVLTPIAGASTVVPVPGRPSTYFTFDAATGAFTTGVIPVPPDTQCPLAALGGLILLVIDWVRRRREEPRGPSGGVGVKLALAATLALLAVSCGDSRVPSPSTSSVSGSGSAHGFVCATSGGECKAPNECTIGQGILGSDEYNCGGSRRACCLETCGTEAEDFECCNADHTYAPRPLCQDGALQCPSGYTRTAIGACLR